MTLTPGDYWIGFWGRSSTTNANWFSFVYYGEQGINFPPIGYFGVGSNSTVGLAVGHGTHSASGSTLSNAYAISDIVVSGLAQRRANPVLYFYNSTI